MKCVVVGGCGFVGSHLVDALLAENNRVVVVDNLSSNTVDPDHWGDDVEVWQSDDSAQIIWGECHEVYHLASVVGPVGVTQHGGKIAHRTLNGVRNVASKAATRHICMLYVSSSEVYGANGECAEDAPCVIRPHQPSPRLEYAVAKLAAEVMLLNTEGLDVRIVRPFNIAGPRQQSRGGFVIPRFVEQALAGRPLTVYGDGKQLRAFTHVKDIVEGIITVMRSGSSGKCYNLGNLENLTTMESLALYIGHAAAPNGHSIEHIDPITLHGPKFAEAGNKWPSPRMMALDLGWKPTRSLKQIIAEVVEERRSHA